MVVVERRTSPRASAIATTSPMAAEVKFRTASPAIWVRQLIVVSDARFCQLVLVSKLIAATGGTQRCTLTWPADPS